MCGLADQNCENVLQCTRPCGQIKSVNYPANYGNNHRCRWSIRAPDAHYVNLTIIDFDIPSANNASILGTCIFDYLTIIDGYTGKRLGCHCNENLPPTHIVSPWNELIIQFDTNSETTGRGFHFEYEFMKLELSDSIRALMEPSAPSDQQMAALIESGAPLDAAAAAPPATPVSPALSARAGRNMQLGAPERLAIGSQLASQRAAGSNRSPHALINHAQHVVLLNQTMSGGLIVGSNATSAALNQRAKSVCLPGWHYFRDSCYRAFSEDEPLQWYDAENKCNAHGKGLDGHLVSILDQDEMYVILYMLTYVWRSARYRDYYIGLIDVSREGVYRWSDNNPMSYTDWELRPMLLEDEVPAQPDGGAYEDCTIIRYTSFWRTSNWHDVPCSLGKHYHYHLDKTTQSVTYKWDYVDSYICKSDSISTGVFSRTRGVRRPLFSNEFKPPAARNLSAIAAPHSSMNAHNTSTMTNLTTVATPSARNRRLLEAALDDNRYFVCDNLEVISVVLTCDGIAHCRDGSDESHGCKRDCLEWQFKCANGRCISIGNYCDFVDDCGDGSDETRCERPRCKLNEFRCQSGQCIQAAQRCDLLPDCSDASDEGRLCTIGTDCNTASTFQCYNGNCIPRYAVCDYQIDCSGKYGEDEDPATCKMMLNQCPIDNSTASSSVIATQIEPQMQQQECWRKDNQFKCKSGNMIDDSLRCLYEFDKYGYQIGCRDVSHLIGCADFKCPTRDYVKCSNSYCIPWRYICDGKWDCIMGEDEIGCARYLCPGQYKCANQSSCILLHQLCDGHKQCPMGDDERFCDLACPSHCDCIGQAVMCRGAQLTNLPSDYISKSVRKLDLSYNRLGPNLSSSDFSAYHDLGELILRHNNIKVLIPRKFNQLRNLYKLDLSNNQIHSVKRGAFAGLRRVTQLLLESNPELVILEPEAFLGLSSLQMLNISSSRIMALRKNTFDGLTSLRHLLLRSNMIVEVEDGAFRSLTSLVSLDMRGNEVRHFTKSVFSELKSLRNLSTDSFKFCCLMSQQIPADRCLPLPDEISDCEDLLSSPLQRTCNWIAGGAAVLGNLIVIVWRYRDRLFQKEREDEQVNSTLLLSLGCSDLIMGVCQIIIAIVDSYYRGRYIENADNWRESALCNLCGFLSTISIEASIVTLVLIARNRYTVICHPFSSPAKFTLGLTHRLIMGSWCFALLIATLPLLLTLVFRGQFFARSGVCLAFHITNQKATGWLYSISDAFNLLAFAYMASCYARIYATITRSSRLNRSSMKFVGGFGGSYGASNKSGPTVGQLKIGLIVLNNFVACVPAIVLRLMSFAGVPLPAAVYSWVAVLVLPVYSAINPMIYTIPNIRNQIRQLIRNHKARKSGAAAAGEHPAAGRRALNVDQLSGQSAAVAAAAAKNMLVPAMLTERADVRQRLAQRNVPPGYIPVKQYVLHDARVDTAKLVELALEIARDIEAKHNESKVYVSLMLDNIFVTDKIELKRGDDDDTGQNFQEATTKVQKANGHTTSDIHDNSRDDEYELTNMAATSKLQRRESKLHVFVADYEGYRSKRPQCNHEPVHAGSGGASLSLAGASTSSAPVQQQLHYGARQHRSMLNCECADVSRFGDILFKLIQLYNTRRVASRESSRA